MRRSIDSTSVPPSRAFLIERLELRQRLVDQERRRHEPFRACRLNAAKLPVELLRVGLQPGQIRVGVRGLFDAVLGIEKPRDIEIGADVLDDHVRRDAPSANGDVAVRHREALERRGVGTAHDLEAGARRMREARGVERVRPLQVTPQLARDPLLSLRRAIHELRTKLRSRAGVDAERRGGLGHQPQQAVADVVEQRARVGLGVCRRGRRRRSTRFSTTRGHQRQRGGARECGDGLATSQQGIRQWHSRLIGLCAPPHLL